ncbi:MAG: chemotaxis protein CheB, partial [Gammaproteobacteria bacterium]|nr:chemotaxis protein CheB [Gammaproteobacteria bacterium]
MNQASKTTAVEQHFIVGLGASAGGLEALEAFFSNMPVDTGMSFVVIQHLAPDFKSLMDELLTRHTDMAIHIAENNMAVEPNSIYLIPPKKEMVIAYNRLLLRDRNPAGMLNLPIDIFFHSLAEQVREKAIGIIFSGTGSDGSRGIAAIHEHGGFVMCQSPESAKFDGMPNSAIATGVIDVIINPNEMPDVLQEYVRHTNSFLGDLSRKVSDPKLDIYAPIFDRLNSTYDVDFQFYKPSTVGRRIERRMALHRIQTVNEYIEYTLNEENNELELLYRDLLIGVTQFFRDAEVWGYLAHKIIPSICNHCTNEKEVRFWVPGCATGEEAYSLAILAHEALTEKHKPLNIRIFATDLHKDSLAYAGRGFYPASSLANMSKNRIQRYFTQHGDDKYEVSPEIRRMVVFAHHNVLKDPPFAKLDLISCRNLLIYFLPDAQKRVLSLLHFALKVGGMLLLGPSESLGDIKAEFEPVDKTQKLFVKRRDIRLGQNIRLGNTKFMPKSGDEILKGPNARQGQIGGRDINLIKAYDTLLHQYVPPSVLIENSGLLAHTFGSAGDYLRPPTGVSSLDLLDMIHPDLRMAVSTGLQRATKENGPISYGGIQVKLSDEDCRIVRVTVRSLSDYKPSDYILVSFEEIDRVREASVVQPADAEVDDVQTDAQAVSSDHVKHLEEELRYTKENLQATVEELETSNEELQATNEELMASNEELQSTNEELHSVNEELYTVNKEYEEKIIELTQLTDDMDNLLACTDIGTIFLDKELKIRKFTPAAARQFSLLAQDIGRPIMHLNKNIEFDDFHGQVERTLNEGVASTYEVRNKNEEWYLLGLHPYRNDKNETTGVVITFVEITLLKKASMMIAERNEELQSFA